MTDSPYIHSLHFYPIKSCAGIDMNVLHVGERGFVAGIIRDRSWIVTDLDNVMITQRVMPELARVKTELVLDANGIADKVRLSAPNMPFLILNAEAVIGEQQNLVIHNKQTVGHEAPAAASQWFSDFLGKPVRLMHQTEDDVRLCDENFAINPGIDAVGYADGYPYLVTTQGTLDKLNGALETPVPMNRFRPNVVVGGTEAEAEYGWQEIGFGDAKLAIVKPCTRCIMTTVDQELGQKTNKEPLATLARSHMLSQNFGGVHVQGAVFGENAIPLETG